MWGQGPAPRKKKKKKFPEKGLRGYSPISYIHVSVSDLYIPLIIKNYRTLHSPHLFLLMQILMVKWCLTALQKLLWFLCIIFSMLLPYHSLELCYFFTHAWLSQLQCMLSCVESR
jgi:hypothetical protein